MNYVNVPPQLQVYKLWQFFGNFCVKYRVVVPYVGKRCLVLKFVPLHCSSAEICVEYGSLVQGCASAKSCEISLSICFV